MGGFKKLKIKTFIDDKNPGHRDVGPLPVTREDGRRRRHDVDEQRRWICASVTVDAGRAAEGEFRVEDGRWTLSMRRDKADLLLGLNEDVYMVLMYYSVKNSCGELVTQVGSY